MYTLSDNNLKTRMEDGIVVPLCSQVYFIYHLIKYPYVDCTYHISSFWILHQVMFCLVFLIPLLYSTYCFLSMKAITVCESNIAILPSKTLDFPRLSLPDGSAPFVPPSRESLHYHHSCSQFHCLLGLHSIFFSCWIKFHKLLYRIPLCWLSLGHTMKSHKIFQAIGMYSTWPPFSNTSQGCTKAELCWVILVLTTKVFYQQIWSQMTPMGHFTGSPIYSGFQCLKFENFITAQFIQVGRNIILAW